MIAADAYQRRVGAYYREIGSLLTWELANRDDEGFWNWIVSRECYGFVLEIGCGAGRVTQVLAQSGAPILAVDLSRTLLERAARRASGLSNVQFVRADFRMLPTTDRFGLVVAAGDPFSHMVEEWRRANSFQAVADRLEVGGIMVLDALWFSLSQRAAARGPEGLRKEHVTETEKGRLRVKETWQLGSDLSRCQAVYEYWLENDLLKRVDFTGRMWSYQEIRQRCESCGLRMRRCWGDYDRSPWNPDTSGRLIVEAIRS